MKTKFRRTKQVRLRDKADPDRTYLATVDFDIEIDLEGLLEHLAYRAYNSKGRKATGMGGAVVVRPMRTMEMRT